MARTPSQKEIAAFIVGHGIVDFVSGGKLSLIERNAIWKAVKKLGPIAGRAAVGTASVAGRSLVGAAAPIAGSAAFGPAAGLALGYGALQTPQVQQLLEMAEERGRMDRIRFEQGLTDLGIAAGDVGRRLADINVPIVGVRQSRFAPKRKSAYNSAVSRGMKALKKSTSYGKKGVLSTPKKAFGFVARTVSKLRRGKKVSSKGASGVVKRSIKITVRKP